MVKLLRVPTCDDCFFSQIFFSKHNLLFLQQLLRVCLVKHLFNITLIILPMILIEQIVHITVVIQQGLAIVYSHLCKFSVNDSFIFVQLVQFGSFFFCRLIIIE
uniref:Uncharacterized protein n=1 Tax=Cacopsylla melanoneura TaxID=428564 RepID=A0A8D8UB85_9HEMI